MKYPFRLFLIYAFILPITLFLLIDKAIDRFFPDAWIWAANHAPSINEDDALKQQKAFLEKTEKKKIFLIGLSHAKYSIDPDIVNARLPDTYQFYNIAMGNAISIDWAMQAQLIKEANPDLVVWLGESYVLYWQFREEQLKRSYNWQTAIEVFPLSFFYQHWEEHLLGLAGQNIKTFRFRASIRRIASAFSQQVVNGKFYVEKQGFNLFPFYREPGEEIANTLQPLVREHVDIHSSAFSHFASIMQEANIDFLFLYGPTASIYATTLQDEAIPEKFNSFVKKQSEIHDFSVMRMTMENVHDRDKLFYDWFHPNGGSYKLISGNFSELILKYLSDQEK